MLNWSPWGTRWRHNGRLRNALAGADSRNGILTTCCPAFLLGVTVSARSKPDATQVDLKYLTNEDITAKLRDIISSAQEGRYATKIATREASGACPSVALQDLLAFYKEQIEIHKRRQQVVNEMPLVLGRVLLSPGALFNLT